MDSAWNNHHERMAEKNIILKHLEIQKPMTTTAKNLFKKLEIKFFELKLRTDSYTLMYKDVEVVTAHMMFERKFSARRKMNITYRNAEERIEGLMKGKGTEPELAILEAL